MTRKERFLHNVTQRMAELGLTETQLASDLGLLDRDSRKWLGRLLKDGLSQPHKASVATLKLLAERLGFLDVAHCWGSDPLPQFIEKPEHTTSYLIAALAERVAIDLENATNPKVQSLFQNLGGRVAATELLARVLKSRLWLAVKKPLMEEAERRWRESVKVGSRPFIISED